MTNNLTVLKKDLKSFAKRVKDFKYTESALITFLLTGLIELTGVSFNLFSAENEIQAQTKAINTSITNLKSDFRFARHENDKLLRKTNLELVKLMEQGDHVVKSPWSSWQYGINGFYNSWQGSYKGRGDKTADYKYERDKTMSKTKYEAYPHTLYGNTTELGLKQEPNASIPVSATLNPLIPKVKHANVSMAVDISELPSFTPRTVNPPEKPNIDTTVSVNAPKFSLTGESFANYGERFFDVASDKLIRIKNTGGTIDFDTAPSRITPTNPNGYESENGGGVIESVAILGGTFATERLESTGSDQHYPYGDSYRYGGIWEYAYKNFTIANSFSGDMQTDNKKIIDYMKTSPTPSSTEVKFFYDNKGNKIETGILKVGGKLSDMDRDKGKTALKTGFMRMASNIGGLGNSSSTMLNNGNIIYTRNNTVPEVHSPGYELPIRELVHLDTHGAAPITAEEVKLNTVLNNSEVSAVKTKVEDAWKDFVLIAGKKSLTKS